MVEVEEGLPVGWLVGVCVGVLLSVVFSRVTESLDVIMLGSCQFERLPYLVPVYQIVVKFCLRYRRSLYYVLLFLKLSLSPKETQTVLKALVSWCRLERVTWLGIARNAGGRGLRLCLLSPDTRVRDLSWH